MATTIMSRGRAFVPSSPALPFFAWRMPGLRSPSSIPAALPERQKQAKKPDRAGPCKEYAHIQ